MPNDIRQLIYHYSDETLSSAQIAKLSEWIVSSPKHARYFYRNFAEQRALVIALGGRQIKVNDVPQDEEVQANGLELLNELTAMEANRPIDSLVDITARVLKEEQEADRRVQLDKEPKRPRVIIIPRVVAWGSIAAVLILGLFLISNATQTTPADPEPAVVNIAPPANDSSPVIVADTAPPAPVASLAADFESVWEGPISPVVGEQMVQGAYHLLHGRAKLHFDSGALVMVESPARFTLDCADQMTVHSGQVMAYCDADAHGFAIQTPDAAFVDLGTEFGVHVIPDQESQLHVFKGEVLASTVCTPEDATVVRETQAVSVLHQARSLHALPKADQDSFAAMRRVEIPIVNTGESMTAQGGWDTHWRVTHINGELLDEPARTRLFTPPAFDPSKPHIKFHPNVHGQITWITADPAIAGTNEKSYTYQTRFDINGMDMASLRLQLGLRADNYFDQIRLNGKLISVPSHSSNPPFDPLISLQIEEGFIVGENILEVVAHNLTDHRNTQGNYSALIAELKLTARVDWKQAGIMSDATYQ